MVYQEGQAEPRTAEVQKRSEVVRKIVVDAPGRHTEYHVGAKVEADGDSLRVDLGDNE